MLISEKFGMMTCSCGLIVLRDDIREFKGKDYCDECYDEHIYECEGCGNDHLYDDMEELTIGWVCEDCREDYVPCEACGDDIVKDDGYSLGDPDNCEYICNTCYDNNHSTCSDCSRVHHFDDMRYIDSGDYHVCEDCFDESYFTCEHCNREHNRNDLTTDDHNTIICDTCYDHHYVKCDECDRLLRTSDAYHDERRDEWLCDEHRPSDVIKSYDWTPNRFIKYGDGKLAQKGMYMGVELEVDRGGEDDLRAKQILDAGYHGYDEDYLYAQHDGSLDDGFEIVSHPATLEYHLESMGWENILRKADKLGYSSHNVGTCGIHVHVSRFGLGDSSEAREDGIGKMVYLFEKFWDKILRFSRRTEAQVDEWAQRYDDGRNYDYYCEQSVKDLGEYAKGDYAKYRAVNLCHPCTVELRIFRGTLKYSTFVATLQFCQVLADICRELTFHEVIELTWEGIKKRSSEYTELMEYYTKRGI